MQKLIWKNALGDEIDLTSGNYGITEWEGFSNASLNIQSQQVPFQDGGVFLDALIEQRELSVTLAMQDNNNLEERYKMRRELIHSLNPKLGEGYLIYTNDFISKRIKCVAQIPLFETHNSNDSGTPKASLAWTACEPYWEDVEETTVVVNAEEINNIKNNGDVPCKLDIDLYNIGSENISVENITENKSVLVTGLHDKIVNINTGFGKKIVENKEIKAKTFLFGNSYSTMCYDSLNKEYILAGNYSVVKTKDFKYFDVYKINYSIQNIYYFTTNKFVATDGSGNVLYSYNAIDWFEANISYNLIDVFYVDEKYYSYAISGNNTLIFESTNAEEWTTTTVSDIKLKSIAYSEELEAFFGVTTNEIYSSEDFIQWTLEQTFSAYYDLQKIYYVKKANLVIVANEISYSSGSERRYLKCLYSANGTTWLNATMGENYIASGSSSIIAGNRSRGFYVINGYNIYNSITGESWEKVGTRSSLTNKIIMVDSLGDFVIIGSGYLETLLTEQIKLLSISAIKDIAYSKKLNRYVMITSSTIYVSNNKVIWNSVAQKSNLLQILYVEEFGKFFLTCISNSIYYTSEDGIEWVEHNTMAGVYQANQIKYIPELKKLFIVGRATSSTYGKIAYTSDGINWSYGSTTDIPTTPFKEIYSIAYSAEEKRLIAVGYGDYSSTTYYSDDGGHKWDYRVQARGDCLYYSKYLKKVFSKSAYTVDGLMWINTNNLNLDKMCFAEDLAIFIGIKGTNCYISYNCQEWRLLNLKLKSEVEFEDIRYIQSDNTFYLIGRIPTINYYYTYVELKLEKGENIINEISNKSDMTLGLEVGENEIRISCEEGFLMGKISYRQKYIGV